MPRSGFSSGSGSGRASGPRSGRTCLGGRGRAGRRTRRRGRDRDGRRSNGRLLWHATPYGLRREGRRRRGGRELRAAVVVEAFVGLGQQAPTSVERVVFAAPMSHVSFCTRRRHSSSLWFASFTTWNGSATWTASGSIVSNTTRYGPDRSNVAVLDPRQPRLVAGFEPPARLHARCDQGPRPTASRRGRRRSTSTRPDGAADRSARTASHPTRARSAHRSERVVVDERGRRRRSRRR